MSHLSTPMPSPSKDERARPDFDLSKWCIDNGICWVSGGRHIFAPEFPPDAFHPHPRKYCRRCAQGRDWLITRARGGVVYESEFTAG